MARRRVPYLSILVATAVALTLVAILGIVVAAPITPGCFEWCNVGQVLAVRLIGALSVLWLFIALTIAWYWEPAITAATTIAASVLLMTFVVMALGIVQLRPSGLDFESQILLLALGLQLPGVWRLASGSHRPRLGRAASWVMGAAVAVAGAGVVFGGSMVFGWGNTAVGLALVVFLIALATLAITGLAGRPRAESIAIGMIALGAALPFVGVAARVIIQGGVDEFAIVGFILVAVGWFALGLGWLRSRADATP